MRSTSRRRLLIPSHKIKHDVSLPPLGQSTINKYAPHRCACYAYLFLLQAAIHIKPTPRTPPSLELESKRPTYVLACNDSRDEVLLSRQLCPDEVEPSIPQN